MAFRFKLTEHPGDENSHSGEGDWYEFGPSGILGVHYGNPDRDSEYYSPHAWTELITDQPPGKPTSNEVWGFWA